jgi:hypothetical protein
MADNELARILASGEQPVSPMERELAAWNKKLGQKTGATAGDERLARILAGGGIGSDARMPVAPVMRDPVMERQIQVRTMSGREPTPEQRHPPGSLVPRCLGEVAQWRADRYLAGQGNGQPIPTDQNRRRARERA